jgi:hypothetical protein
MVAKATAEMKAEQHIAAHRRRQIDRRHVLAALEFQHALSD